MARPGGATPSSRRVGTVTVRLRAMAEAWTGTPSPSCAEPSWLWKSFFAVAHLSQAWCTWKDASPSASVSAYGKSVMLAARPSRSKRSRIGCCFEGLGSNDQTVWPARA